MTGSQPLTNCRCLALVDFSATRKTTKLAGTKDMATMMKMAMTTSVPCSLSEQGRLRYRTTSELTHDDNQGQQTDMECDHKVILHCSLHVIVGSREKLTGSREKDWHWCDSLGGLLV